MSYKIVSKKELCPNQYEITIEAPYVVRNAKAGQFIIFRAEKDSERVPLTIADVDKENGLLTLVFMAVGYSTKQLAALNVGDELADLVGPLGQPTHIKKYGALFANHKHSDETKNKISAAKKGKCCGKANSMHGKIWICNDKTH